MDTTPSYTLETLPTGHATICAECVNLAVIRVAGRPLCRPCLQEHPAHAHLSGLSPKPTVTRTDGDPLALSAPGETTPEPVCIFSDMSDFIITDRVAEVGDCSPEAAAFLNALPAATIQEAIAGELDAHALAGICEARVDALHGLLFSAGYTDDSDGACDSPRWHRDSELDDDE